MNALAQTGAPLNQTTSFERHRFHYLDGMRGLAALIVVMRHAFMFTGYSAVVPNSYLAVDFFFCLSGFVIDFSYGKRLGATLTFQSFSLARLIRLYPLAFFGTVLGLGVLLAEIHLRIAPVASVSSLLFLTLRGMLLWPDLSGGHIFPLDVPIWSLFFELIANLVYAAAARMGAITNRAIAAVCVLSLVPLAAARVHFHTFDVGFTFHTMPVGLARVAVSFTLGVLVHRLFQRHFAIGQKMHTAAYGLGGAVLLACLLCNFLHLTQTAGFQLVVLTVLFPGLVYVGAQIKLSQRVGRLCALLGLISYPLYILHLPLLFVLMTASVRHFESMHPVAMPSLVILYSLFLMVPAWAVARCYDGPLRAFLSKCLTPQKLAGPGSRSPELLYGATLSSQRKDEPSSAPPAQPRP